MNRTNERMLGPRVRAAALLATVVALSACADEMPREEAPDVEATSALVTGPLPAPPFPEPVLERVTPVSPSKPVIEAQSASASELAASGCLKFKTTRLQIATSIRSDMTTATWLEGATDYIYEQDVIAEEKWIGTHYFTFRTCLKKGGKWTLFDVDISDTDNIDLTLSRTGREVSVTPADGHNGAGLLPKGLTSDGALSLEPVMCQRNPHFWKGTFEILTDLPWPGKPIIGVATYVANLVISAADKKRYSCMMLKANPSDTQPAKPFLAYVGISVTGEVGWTKGVKKGGELGWVTARGVYYDTGYQPTACGGPCLHAYQSFRTTIEMDFAPYRPPAP